MREGGKYVVRASAPRESELHFLISDHELVPRYRRITSTRTKVEWDWQISEYAGEVTATLLDGEKVCIESILDIPPNSRKLGRDAYRELLADLQAIAEGVVFGTTPAQEHLARARCDTPEMAKFALLRAYIAKVEQAFRSIKEAPHRRLFAERENRPIQRVRRVDGRSLRSALKRIPVLAALGKGEAKAYSGGRPMVDVPRKEHTFDTSLNRHLLLLLSRLIAECDRLRRAFDSNVPKDSGAIESRNQRCSRMVGQYATRIEQLTRAPFLADLKPREPDAGALVAVATHPAYSQLDQLVRLILRLRVALGNDPEKKLALRPTRQLYEYWCFFKVAALVKSVCADFEWKERITSSGRGLLLALPDGSSLVGSRGDIRIILEYQKHFSPHDKSPAAFSISKECIPDIVLTRQDSTGCRTLVLDVKYRSGIESIHQALFDIHVYRDAIRNSSFQSAVYAAYILTPAHAKEAERYFTDDYRKDFRFGGFDLSPGNTQKGEDLRRALIELLL